jgi:hypothetical protein
MRGRVGDRDRGPWRSGSEILSEVVSRARRLTVTVTGEAEKSLALVVRDAAK